MKRVVHHRIRCCNRTFDIEEWCKYLDDVRNGRQERITTTFGRFTFNDCDICTNPDTYTLETESKNSYGYRVEIYIAECGNGIWVYGLDEKHGDGGSCFGASWSDDRRKGFPSEKEAKDAACRYVIDSLSTVRNYSHADMVKVETSY